MTDVVVTGLTIRPLEQAIVRQIEAAADFAVGEVLGYINADDELAVADASAEVSTTGPLALRVTSGTSRSDGTLKAGEWCTIVIFGPVAGFTGLDPTEHCYVSNTAGKIADAAGTVSRFVGHPLEATVFFFAPSPTMSS